MFENIKSAYFIGIGGVSMSALALLLLDKGIKVYGSDLRLSEVTRQLQQKGIDVVDGSAPHFVEECDICIVTGAVGEDNQDLILARKLGKKVYSRAELLGALASEKKCISIAGTHGKTTTTGMLATIMLFAGLDPMIHVGGVLNEIGSNLHIGKGEYFLTEACEYKDSFLSLKSDISVILNIEPDHLDYFKTVDNLQKSFEKFAKNTKKYGFLVKNSNIKGDLFKGLNVLSFGFDKRSIVQAQNIREYEKAKYAYDLFVCDEFVGEVYLSAFGKHNVENSLAAIGVALLLDIDFKDIQKGLKEYKGVARRMDLVREKGPMIIHDYAHHPTEIESTIDACRRINKNLIVVFQPHTFTRTRDLYEEFLSCFAKCSQVWLLPIYPAREKLIVNISSKRLSDDLTKKGVKSRYFSSFDECKKAILGYEQKYLFAILGAGDIEELAQSLKKT